MRRHSGLRELGLLGVAAVASFVLLTGCRGSSAPPTDGALPSLDGAPRDLARADRARRADARSPDAWLLDVGADLLPPTALHVASLEDGQVGSGSFGDPYRDLQWAMDQAPSGATLFLRAGTYRARPTRYVDPTCGNCGDASFREPIVATRGFLVTGKGLHLVGEQAERTLLVTSAGYGLVFENAGRSSVHGVTVTGGRRDPDGRATNGAIVVRRSELVVDRVRVVGNDGLRRPEQHVDRPADGPVVGVAGIVGREGARLVVAHSIVEDNSWDGIVLYRGDPEAVDGAPRAEVTSCRVGCTVDCVVRHGRGVGIAATWDASLTVTGSVVQNYWKGIGAFGRSVVHARNNLVRRQVGWGVVVTDQATLFADNNVVVDNGTTGVAAWTSTVRGRLVNNVVMGNGRAQEEWVGKRTGLWFNASADRFRVAYNFFFDNHAADACQGGRPGGLPCIPLAFDGVEGNRMLDPRLGGAPDYRPLPDSPVRDGGDPAVRDRDGSRSDVGLYGGPDGVRMLP